MSFPGSDRHFKNSGGFAALNALARVRSPSWMLRYVPEIGGAVFQYTAEANWDIINNRIESGAIKLAKITSKYPRSIGPIASLGFALSGLSHDCLDRIWAMLKPQWEGINHAHVLDKKSFPFFCLGVEVALMRQPDVGKNAITNIYKDFIFKNEIIAQTKNSPFLFWHIPKCGGTSFVSALASLWYKSGYRYFPNYTSRRFLSELIESGDELFPFLSSGHVPCSDFDMKAARKFKQILVWRAPHERALSAWRQYRAAPLKRLWILPQHGAVWRYFPVCDLRDWSCRAPTQVTNPFSWTFSASQQLIEDVDEKIHLTDLSTAGRQLLDKYDLSIESLHFYSSKNVTDKSVRPCEAHLNDLDAACVVDKEFLRATFGCAAKRSDYV